MRKGEDNGEISAMTKVDASVRTVELATLVTFLQTAMSFDRPVEQERALQDARDIMLECGFPVANDFRTIGSTPWAEHVQRHVRKGG